ncbi:MAG: spore coat protein [Clostridiales bacterium]|jgi:spore coat protein CotF|nr:spore coat protein [Clostridiales bacterium]
MQEKDMVLDVLSGIKSSISNYAKTISECADQDLRKTFQKMRDGDEQFQYDLFKIAEQKGYYSPAPQASLNDSANIKTQLVQSLSA